MNGHQSLSHSVTQSLQSYQSTPLQRLQPVFLSLMLNRLVEGRMDADRSNASDLLGNDDDDADDNIDDGYDDLSINILN